MTNEHKRSLTVNRIAYSCAVAGLAVSLAFAATAGETQPPPRPDDEWTQEQWPDMPGRQDGPMGFEGVRPPGPGRGPADFQRRMEQMQRWMQQMQLQADQSKNRAIREALQVTEEQYRRIKPKLENIERLKAAANASIDPASFGGGPGFAGGGTTFGGGWAGGFASGSMGAPGRDWSRSWSSGPPSAHKGPGERTRGDVLCEELLGLLQSPSAPAAAVIQKVEALRRTKEQARRQVAQQRQALRELVNPRQEAVLIVMGYLD